MATFDTFMGVKKIPGEYMKVYQCTISWTVAARVPTCICIKTLLDHLELVD